MQRSAALLISAVNPRVRTNSHTERLPWPERNLPDNCKDTDPDRNQSCLHKHRIFVVGCSNRHCMICLKTHQNRLSPCSRGPTRGSRSRRNSGPPLRNTDCHSRSRPWRNTADSSDSSMIDLTGSRTCRKQSRSPALLGNTPLPYNRQITRSNPRPELHEEYRPCKLSRTFRSRDLANMFHSVSREAREEGDSLCIAVVSSRRTDRKSRTRDSNGDFYKARVRLQTPEYSLAFFLRITGAHTATQAG